MLTLYLSTHLSPFHQVNEVRKILGPLADKLPTLCSDASIIRYLKARNWNTKKAAKMLKETLKWRLVYKPEKIRWVNSVLITNILHLVCTTYFLMLMSNTLQVDLEQLLRQLMS